MPLAAVFLCGLDGRGRHEEPIRFVLNGQPATLETEEERSLLWVLRSDLELTGTKFGCGIGACGSCTVLVDGGAVRSCMTPLSRIQGKEVVTIEGLARGPDLHPLQKAFIDHGAFQCAFCTPGMLMSAAGLLRSNPKAGRGDILRGMENNLCRCGAHQRILAAIEAAAKQGGGL